MKSETQLIEAELEKARKQLLDLTLRNKLINFRPTKRTTVQVVHESPDEIFSALVLEQRQLRFKAAEKSLEAAGEDEPIAEDLIAHDERSQRDNYLQTNLQPASLEKSLLQIKLKSDTVFEEQGYTVLYLAMGFLDWKERQDAETGHRAPLVLLPVSIERKSVGSAFALKWTEEDLATNVSLQAKLKEIRVSLPEFEVPEEKGGIQAYLDSVKEAVRSRSGWAVSADIYLGFFSFNKFVMWRDLTPQDPAAQKKIVSHELLRSVFTGDKAAPGSDELGTEDFAFDEQEVAQLPIREQFHIMDADASQVAVIEAVKKGINLVVEGPPGTGKSQTIANIIAELLAKGRKVLFVSEKMAALEVVKDRLDTCGLGDACLELHSRHSNKRLVLEELERTTRARPPAGSTSEQAMSDRERLAKELDGYVEVLRTEIGAMKRTPFALFGLYVRARQVIESRGHKVWHAEVDDSDQLSVAAFESGKSQCKSLAESIKVIRPIASNPWRHCDTSSSFFDSDRMEVGRQIETAQRAIQDLYSSAERLSALAGTGSARSRQACRSILKASSCMAEAPQVEAAVLLDGRWDTAAPEVESLLQQLAQHQGRLNLLDRQLDFSFSRAALSSLSQALEDCQSLILQLEQSWQQLSAASGVQAPGSLEASALALEAASLLAGGMSAEVEVLRNEAWNSTPQDAQQLIKSVDDLQSERPWLDSTFTAEALTLASEDLPLDLEALAANPLRFLMPRFWQLRKRAQELHRSRAPLTQLVANLNRLLKYKTSQKSLAAQAAIAQELFGTRWNGAESNTKDLRAFAAWVVKFRGYIVQGQLTSQAYTVASQGQGKQLSERISHTDQIARSTSEALTLLCQKLGLSDLASSELNTHQRPLKTLNAELEQWIKSLAVLDSWMEYRLAAGTGEVNNLSSQLLGRSAGPNVLLAQIAELVSSLQLRDDLLSRESAARHFFGRLWQGESSSVAELQSFQRWAGEFRRHFNAGALSQESAQLVENGVSKSALIAGEREVDHCAGYVETALQQLADRLGFNAAAAFAEQWDDIDFASWQAQLSDWQHNLDRLPGWAHFGMLRKDLRETPAGFMISPLERDEIDPDDAVATYELNVAASLLRVAFKRHSALSKFVAEVHEGKIGDFARIDKELQKLNRQRVIRILHAARPNLDMAGGLSQSEAGILLGEFTRKRKHMPIRKLLAVAGRLIQRIKPCFMMSPLSIAQFLELGNLEFDTVIFDEASQVKPEDALGAMLRGRQLVVMGDSRQLPPTSFFDKIDDEETDEEQENEEGQQSASIVDVESILVQCQRSFARKSLRWHYRSRHESLIAVSNFMFYHNHLLIYPSVAASLPGVGLELRRSEGSSYDRGKSAQNKEEARQVVAAALEHFRQYPDRSLGIGTFSIKQQEAILDEIEKAMRFNPELQDHFSSKRKDYCFVKNLETIQGDERDVIFVSVGYGKANPLERVNMNFGPINKDGGQRRLNVLMTRARQRCVIFANFGAEEFLTTPSSPPGMRALKHFLEYAQTRQLNVPDELSDDTDSPFEDSVKDFLESHGHEVQSQVGCAGYRIDMAIRHPDRPGSYLLAIECDGSMYHSSPVARDRDRLRQQVLEEMGWRNRIHRIWSTDWFHNYAAASARLLRAIEEARRIPMDLSAVPAVADTEWQEEPHEVESPPAEPREVQLTLTEPYRTCERLSAILSPQLHDSSPIELAKAVVEVVSVESPIHIEGLIRRIRSLCGLQRAGARIRPAIEGAAELAVSQGKIRKSGDCYLLYGDDPIPVRVRGREILANEPISDEEIGAAYTMLLRTHFSSPEAALIQAAARLFGYQAVHEGTVARFNEALRKSIKLGALRVNSQGNIELAEI